MKDKHKFTPEGWKKTEFKVPYIPKIDGCPSPLITKGNSYELFNQLY